MMSIGFVVFCDEEFEMTDLAPLKVFLGIEIRRNRQFRRGPTLRGKTARLTNCHFKRMVPQ